MYANSIHFALLSSVQVINVYMRFKHWFQDEDLEQVPEKSAVVSLPTLLNVMTYISFVVSC